MAVRPTRTLDAAVLQANRACWDVDVISRTSKFTLICTNGATAAVT